MTDNGSNSRKEKAPASYAYGLRIRTRLLLVHCSILRQEQKGISTLSRSNSDRLTATAGSDVVQSGRPIFDDFFQHLRPYIGKNTANVVFQMVKRLWLIRIDQ
ncbi:hypothetical protein TNCV_4500221 [Trichonephila clavipes]|nr:hypothetical protein TNCV_4500221 [Trichonephila clavipes]